MAIQYLNSIRDAKLDAIETTILASGAPTLTIWTGSAPAFPSTANAAETVLATIAMGADPFTAASAGVKGKNGTWEDTSADASGTAAHFRVHFTTTCFMQGTVGQGSGDLSLDNSTIASGQTVTITQFDITEGNA